MATWVFRKVNRSRKKNKIVRIRLSVVKCVRGRRDPDRFLNLQRINFVLK